MFLAALHLLILLRQERPLTFDMLEVTLLLGLAGTGAALAAGVANRLLARRPFSARFAAVILVAVAGTIIIVSLLIGAHMVWSVRSDGISHMLRTMVVGPAVAAYSFLGTTGLILMPLAFPLVLVVAWLLARKPR